MSVPNAIRKWEAIKIILPDYLSVQSNIQTEILMIYNKSLHVCIVYCDITGA